MIGHPRDERIRDREKERETSHCNIQTLRERKRKEQIDRPPKNDKGERKVQKDRQGSIGQREKKTRKREM